MPPRSPKIDDDVCDRPRRAHLNHILNAFTAGRLLLVPILMSTFMARPLVTMLSLLAFMVADLFDGVFARRLGADDARRRVVDSVVDRVSIDACLLAATLVGALPPVLLIGFLARDLYCGAICAHLLRERRIVIKVDALYRIPSFLFAAWAMSAPFIAQDLRTLSAVLILAVSLGVAIDLSRLISRARQAPAEDHGRVLAAGLIRAGRLGTAKGQQPSVGRADHAAPIVTPVPT